MTLVDILYCQHFEPFNKLLLDILLLVELLKALFAVVIDLDYLATLLTVAIDTSGVRAAPGRRPRDYGDVPRGDPVAGRHPRAGQHRQLPVQALHVLVRPQDRLLQPQGKWRNSSGSTCPGTTPGSSTTTSRQVGK